MKFLLRVIAILSMGMILILWTDANAKTYVVKRGETFATIAKKHGISEKELQNANPRIKACYAGASLEIPAPLPPVAPKTRYDEVADTRSSVVPTAKINKVWLEHGITINDRSAMKVHCSFDVSGMKGKSGNMCIFIKGPSGNWHRINSNTRTSDGTPYFVWKYTPRYDNATYNDHWYAPYIADLNLLSGKNSYTVIVTITDSNNRILAESSGNIFEGTGNSVGHSPSHQHYASGNRECESCKGSGVCTVCKGRGFQSEFYLMGALHRMPCMLCGGSGRCPACKGSGVMNAMRDAEYEAEAEAARQYSAEMRRQREQTENDRQSIQNQRSKEYEREAAKKGQLYFREECPKCNHTGVNPAYYGEGKTHSSSKTSWLAYINEVGTKCPYCGRYTRHFHDKCSGCNAPSY